MLQCNHRPNQGMVPEELVVDRRLRWEQHFCLLSGDALGIQEQVRFRERSDERVGVLYYSVDDMSVVTEVRMIVDHWHKEKHFFDDENLQPSLILGITVS